MAFEAYLKQGTARSSGGRRLTVLISVVVHGVAVAAAVGYSFWHVEEVRPRSVTVTFVSAASAPMPPPPPPPLGDPSAATTRPKASRPRLERAQPPDVVQPKIEQAAQPVNEVEKAPHEVAHPTVPATSAAASGSNASTSPVPAGSGSPAGTAAGQKGGVSGGTGVSASAAVKNVPPAMGAQQKSFGPDPDFPPHLRTPGASYLVIAKICVAATGTVDTVSVMKRANPTLDENVAATVKRWRFRPLTANGVPIPFCYFGNFQFKSE